MQDTTTEFFTFMAMGAGEFKNISVEADQIKSFGIFNQQRYNKDGSFKKWFKKGYIELRNQRRYHVQVKVITKELKPLLKSQIKETVKTKRFVIKKDFSRRDAIDWEYTTI